MESKRLYRSQTDRKFAGVAGGLGEYFVMDPLLVRLAFVVLALAGGGGFLIYIVLWIVTPENPLRFQTLTGQPSRENQPPAAESPANDGETPPAGETYTTSAPTPVPQTRERKKGSLIGGLVLITLGALFLADELIPQINFGDLWPVILIVIGIGLLINALTGRKHNNNQY
ncbi:MAG: PspC domain-containing protein [Bacteroidota bacterium]